MGANFIVNSSTTVVSLGAYRCVNVSVPRATQLTCRVPAVADADVYKRLNVSVTSAGATSPPLIGGLQTFGDFAVTSVIGCANQSSIGTPLVPAYRTSGCRPGEQISILGTGFGSVAEYSPSWVWVVSGSTQYACTGVSLVNHSTLRCSLSAAPGGQWLSVRVQVGNDAILKPAMIQFHTAPVITAVVGCVLYNSTAASLCRTGMRITIRGANFQAPVSISIGTYLCPNVGLLSSFVIACTIPPIRWQDEGRWLDVTVSAQNETTTLLAAVQSYGNLSVTSAFGCAKQSTVNGTSVTGGCAPGGNVTIIGTGFAPWGMQLYISDTNYLCYQLLYVNNHTLTCVGLPLPSLADVYVPVLLYAAPNLGIGVVSVPLLSFSVVPRVTSVYGCIQLGTSATQCHPQQSFFIYGFNFTSNSVALLHGASTTYTLFVSSPSTSTRLTVLLPAEVQPEDEQRLMSLSVQAGSSTSQRLPNAVWMVNALTVTGIEGCANQTSPTMASMCVAGALVTVRGTGFTEYSTLSVLGLPSSLCSAVTYSAMQCRLPSVGKPVAAPYPVWVVSGTAQSPQSDVVYVQYIPSPDISSVASSYGCTQPRINQAPRDCQPDALLTVIGSGFVPTTTAALYPRNNLPYPCTTLTVPNPTTLVCRVPTLPPSMSNSWLALLVNNSLPTLAAPTARRDNIAYYAGPPANTSSDDTRWGLTIDELVIVIVLVTLVVTLLLGLQAVWCMTRHGVKFGRLERACPKLMKAMKGGAGAREEEGGRAGIHLGLLQHDGQQLQQSEGRRTPYTPFAYQLASASPASPPPPTAPPLAAALPQMPFGYQTYHLPQSAFPSHLAPPGSDPHAYMQYAYVTPPRQQ